MSFNGHEYIVHNGMNRSKVGKTLYSLAAIITTLIMSLLIQYFEWFESVPTLISTIVLTALCFFGIYYSFNNWIWKIKPISKLLKTLDLSGDWLCNGKSDYDSFKWDGQVKIKQSWDKIRIILKTEYSSSESISAVLIYDDMLGYKLIYNYENKPNNLDDNQLKTHIGFVDIDIDTDNESAIGHYYNVSGRKTSGEITWTRR